MNAERLHAIALTLQKELSSSQTLNKFDRLIQALANQVSQPSQPQYQQETSDSLKDLLKTLDVAESNNFSPAWRESLADLGLTGLLGQDLALQINYVFERNQITPAVAQSELQSLRETLQMFSTAIDQIVSSFYSLGVGREDLEPGECEVGILVPRNFVNNQLGTFGDELKELNKIFGVFSELATGSRPGFAIKTISSSELTVFLEAASAVGACIALGLERILELYKKLLEIRKIQAELSSLGLEKKNLKGIEEHSNAMMGKGIEEIASHLISEFHRSADNGRKNELKVELKYALNKISNRIDCGFNFEIRMQAPVQDEADREGEDSDDYELSEKHYKDIAAAAKTLQFLKLEGDSILHLPEEASGKSKENNPGI
ncbi:hypothetical protein [Cyanobium gracile]|uniref:Uncharacterized protein n=1 Tax=Cyanobium gracile (strain ATCC 27147 / PCC 6307) TaxID=292564 RepID=K9PB08_CYAGP|nr:hypothetical protein [Cyanobium gracile]AFY30138.1 hypothetical protein Cyagr_3056 [Cyanobium gracile PCC 6307]